MPANDTRLALLDDAASPDATVAEVARAALDGLTRTPKTLPARLLYDDRGCALFQRITGLPEYYLTRTEHALLRRRAGPALERACAGTDAPVVLVEYGASDEAKAEHLLAAGNAPGMPAISAYVPVDVAAPGLRRLARRLHGRRPELQVRPVATDFHRPLLLPQEFAGWRAFGFFPGSTIGNSRPPEARALLRRMRETLGPQAWLLVGADLRKDPARLLAAYDDAAGVTAAFNLNLLHRLNAEAGADFDLSGFSHRAIWNDAESRIEMHLVSHRRQGVHVAGAAIGFAAGETIHTEDSHKHTEAAFRTLAGAGGWQTSAVWTDPQRLFALYLLRAAA